MGCRCVISPSMAISTVWSKKTGRVELNWTAPCFYSLFSAVQRPTHHHRLQQADECTVTASLLQQGSAHRLLLRLLHQQVQVTHVLHGTVQLGAQVAPACEEAKRGGLREDRQERRRRRRRKRRRRRRRRRRGKLEWREIIMDVYTEEGGGKKKWRWLEHMVINCSCTNGQRTDKHSDGSWEWEVESAIASWCKATGGDSWNECDATVTRDDGW